MMWREMFGLKSVEGSICGAYVVIIVGESLFSEQPR